MSETIESVPTQRADQASAPEGSVPVILELRAVDASPAGALFESYPRRPHMMLERSFLRRHVLFLLLFVLPTALAGLYFGFLAADQYVTEVKYIVRTAGGGDGSGLSSLVQSQGFSRAVDESYAINEYLTSREILRVLDKDGELSRVLSRPESDFLARYPNFHTRRNRETLYQHMKRVVTIEADPSTGINTLEVQTFRPDDSLRLASELVGAGESFINDLNARANSDSMEFAVAIRDEAATRVRDVEKRMTDYRNSERVLDPANEAAATIKALGAMSGQLNIMETQLSQLLAVAPNGPGMTPLRERIKGFRAEYDKLRATLVGGPSSLAGKISGYESLVLEQELAGRALTTAILGVEKARQEAKSRRIYLQMVVPPRAADYPTRPMRLVWTLVVGFLALCFYGIARTFRDTVLEHQA